MKKQLLSMMLAAGMVWSLGLNAQAAGPDDAEGLQTDQFSLEEQAAAHRVENGKGNRMNAGPGGNRGNGGMGQGMPGSEDPDVQSVLEETKGSFESFSWTDEERGITLSYSLFIPTDYNENESYPLIMFIPDATGAGLPSETIADSYYGVAVWASGAEQEKHPSFVLVPSYTETVTDDSWNASSQLDSTVSLINCLAEVYNIDRNRLYATGQSMGCMSSLYLNSAYPDLFAASLYVSGQWDISVLDVLEHQSFFYITAGGDSKASGGQTQVMELFDADQAAYSYGTWSAQEEKEIQDENALALIREGHSANLIRFETGTVLNGENGMEHMASFNYAYKIEAVRDWLFEQSR